MASLKIYPSSPLYGDKISITARPWRYDDTLPELVDSYKPSAISLELVLSRRHPQCWAADIVFSGACQALPEFDRHGALRGDVSEMASLVLDWADHLFNSIGPVQTSWMSLADGSLFAQPGGPGGIRAYRISRDQGQWQGSIVANLGQFRWQRIFPRLSHSDPTHLQRLIEDLWEDFAGHMRTELQDIRRLVGEIPDPYELDGLDTSSPMG